MKKQFLVLIISIGFILAATVASAGNKPGTGQKLFTSHNIWIWPSHNMNCINYKGGRSKIDVGSEVVSVRLIEASVYSETDNDRDRISFKLADSGRTYTMGFTQRYHPGKTIKYYMDRMFTTKNFDELTQGMSFSEKTAIKRGIVVDGMSKEAVLASYGPPPAHATPSLDNNKWKYWLNKRSTQTVFFGTNNRTFNTGRHSLKNPEADAQPTALEDKLMKLKKLFEKGLITSEEYDEKKADLLKDF